jgi:hypothetical protein
VNVALIPPCVPVSASCTRIVFTYKEDTQRGSEVGKIAVEGAVDGDHVSHPAVDVQLTARVGFECGASWCMSAGIQVDKVISITGQFDISQSVGTRDLNERFGPETFSGTKRDFKSMPIWRVLGPRVITDAVPISPRTK